MKKIFIAFFAFLLLGFAFADDYSDYVGYRPFWGDDMESHFKGVSFDDTTLVGIEYAESKDKLGFRLGNDDWWDETKPFTDWQVSINKGSIKGDALFDAVIRDFDEFNKECKRKMHYIALIGAPDDTYGESAVLVLSMDDLNKEDGTVKIYEYHGPFKKMRNSGDVTTYMILKDKKH